MKTRGMIIALLAMLSVTLGHSQAIEITPSYGYQLGGRLNYGPNYFKVQSSGMFGISLGYEIRSNYMLEATYLNMNTELRIRDRIASPVESRLSDANIDWFMVGGTRYFGNDQIRPFFGGQLGLSVFSASNVNRDIAPNGLNNSTNFSFGFKGGVVVMLSERVGINLQGNLLFPVEWGGIYVGAGTGGISTGVNVSSTIVMGGFSGGLVFRLGT